MVLYDETHLQAADTRHAVEIAPRIWWVGEVLADDPFQCHVYLLEQGDQSVLFDPGSRLTFPGTLRKIEEVIPLNQVRYYVCHHPDPDIAAAMPLIDELIDRGDAVLVTHSRAQALLKHYGLRMPFWLVDEHGWRLPLDNREIQFLFTPYAHFPGAFCTFDPQSGVLFSSDLFGGMTTQPTLVARDESHFEGIRIFHEHYMPSRDILGYALSQIDRFPVQAIAPQHGSIIPPRLVPFMVEKLRHLECGIYLFARGDTDMQRLSRLTETLREITQTMLLYRDFGDIAKRLLALVQRSLPARRIDYFGTLDNGSVLMLSPETRFAGIVDDAPPEVLAVLGMTHDAWIAAHAGPAMADHRIYNDTYGHGGGDRVLQAVAALLLGMVREADVLVRYGGEEFICFLVDGAVASTDAFAERLRTTLASHTIDIGDGQMLSVAASIGAARRVPHEPLDHVIRRADEALYQAKQRGRNRVVHADPPALAQQAQWRAAAVPSRG